MRDEDAQRKVDQIAAELATLTQQLNQLHPVSAENAAVGQKPVSDELNARLKLQPEQTDGWNESVQQAQNTASNNAELLQNFLVDMENLADNFKQLRADMEEWGNPNLEGENEEERLYNETAAELLQEVSLSFPAI